MADFVLNKASYLDTPSVEKNKTVNSSNVKRGAKKIVLIFIFALLILLFVILICYYFVFLPNSSIAKIKFVGNDVLSGVFLKRKAGLDNYIKWNKVDSMQVAKRIANISCIESVSVEKKLPDSVLIKISERKPVALTFVQIDNYSVPVLIDKYGILFTSDDIKAENLIIISGLNFESFSEGMHLNSGLIKLLNEIDLLQNKNKKLLNQISEIKIVPKKYGGYDLLLFPVLNKTKVRVQDNLTAEVIQHALLVLDVVNDLQDFANISEIDLRSGIAIIEKDNKAFVEEGDVDE
ncbi:MAG: FtsQ-type POTRA domain-containing protein [Treponemataceae bacterium]